MSKLPIKARTWGFRLSRIDVGVLVAAAVASLALWPFSPTIAPLPILVVGHFFLFCNVFRVRQSFEVSWTVLFLLNACLWWACTDTPSFPVVAITQSPITLGLIVFELFSARYHGIGANKVNRQLPAFLRGEIP